MKHEMRGMSGVMKRKVRVSHFLYFRISICLHRGTKGKLIVIWETVLALLTFRFISGERASGGNGDCRNGYSNERDNNCILQHRHFRRPSSSTSSEWTNLILVSFPIYKIVNVSTIETAHTSHSLMCTQCLSQRNAKEAICGS